MTVFINIHEKEKTHDDLTGVKTCVNNAQWKIKIKQTLNKFYTHFANNNPLIPFGDSKY